MMVQLAAPVPFRCPQMACVVLQLANTVEYLPELPPPQVLVRRVAHGVRDEVHPFPSSNPRMNLCNSQQRPRCPLRGELPSTATAWWLALVVDAVLIVQVRLASHPDRPGQ